jgi:serine/threonine-protein kinase
MGVVYLTHHAVLGRRAAFKVLLPEFSNNQELVGRFFNEARATAQLRHRGFVEVFDSGHLPDGSAYLVMEYLSGANLGACIEHRRVLPLPESLRILRDVAAAVQFAHAHRIVHRDLKPDNIYIATDRDDGGDDQGVTVKVLDFGIAKLSGTGPGDGHNSARTRTGLLLGTPLFMSPEQCRGAGSVDHRSDIYSLGCIAYNMLTGVPPFSFEGFGEIIAAHLSTPASPLRALTPSLPEPIERLVLSMLAKAPGERPQTMSLVCTTIDELRRTLPEAQNGAGLLSLVPPRSAPEPELEPLPDPRSTSRPEVRPALRPGPRAGSASASTPAPAVSTTPAPAVGNAGGRPAGSLDKVASTVTTLRTGAGAIEEGDEALVAPGWSRNKKLAVGGGTAGAVVLIGVLLLHGSGGGAPALTVSEGARPASAALAADHAAPVPSAEPHPSEAAAPAHAPAVAPPAPAPAAPAAHAAPVAPATVTVSITSIPSGAGVVEAASGKPLGTTPFSGTLPRATGGLRLALHKHGYRTKEVSIDVDHDTETAVTLDKPVEKRANDDRRKL